MDESRSERKRKARSRSSSDSDDSSYERRRRRKKEKKRRKKKKKEERKTRKEAASVRVEASEARREAVPMLRDDEGLKTKEIEKKDDEDSDGSDFGPEPLIEADTLRKKSIDYGSAMLRGEGAAMAQYVQKNMRVPRRGEVGWQGDQIERLESVGYVMSGSRHARMNAVRMRKETQVQTAEEKRALALINFEEKQQKEAQIVNDFRSLLEKKLASSEQERAR